MTTRICTIRDAAKIIYDCMIQKYGKPVFWTIYYGRTRVVICG